MKIAVVAHNRHPIARPFMGGMESHCFELVRALEKRGHEVTLFAAPGSTSDNLHAIGPAPYEAAYPWAIWRGSGELARYQRGIYGDAWKAIRTGLFDVVHNNSLFPDLIDWARADGVAMVTSQHVPPFRNMRDTVQDAFGDRTQQFSVTSHHQASLWAPDGAPNLRVVHNGIDLSDWPCRPVRSNRLLWFGRIVENKGLRETVRAALRAGIELDIVGSIEDAAYHEEFVVPHLGGKIRYLGHLSGAELRETVADARAAVVTPMWDEPFGLVAVEAMACGVPVIGFDRGALREVVGDCGIIVPPGDVDRLAEAMRGDLAQFAKRCRTQVEQQFSIDRMIAGYEECYIAAIEGARASPAAVASSASRTVALLP